MAVMGLGVQSMSDAAQLMARQYSLLVTNVPYLAKASQRTRLRDYAERRYPTADRDLATVFLLRLRELRQPGGVLASVLPQSWLYLKSYEALRRHLLLKDSWNLLRAPRSGRVRGHLRGGRERMFVRFQRLIA